MGGAPRNLAPGSNFLVWIVNNHQAATAQIGHLTRRVLTEDQTISQSADPLRSTSPFSDLCESAPRERVSWEIPPRGVRAMPPAGAGWQAGARRGQQSCKATS